MSVYSEIFSCTHAIESILAGGYKGIILSGGPSSVYEDGAPLPPKALFDAGIPLLGICYGMQAMGYLLGGHVVPAERRGEGRGGLGVLQTGGPLCGVRVRGAGGLPLLAWPGGTGLQPPQGVRAPRPTASFPARAPAG